MLQSLNVYFTGTYQVELRAEAVCELKAGEVRVRALASLISAGTERIALGRQFEPGSHWDAWVKYPFAPGYSMVDQVGPAVERLRVGDRVAVRGPHHQYLVVAAESPALTLIPAGLDDAEAAWFALAKIAQVGVRAAAHRLGNAVAIIGLGPVGQLVAQYVWLSGARGKRVLHSRSH